MAWLMHHRGSRALHVAARGDKPGVMAHIMKLMARHHHKQHQHWHRARAPGAGAGGLIINWSQPAKSVAGPHHGQYGSTDAWSTAWLQRVMPPMHTPLMHAQKCSCRPAPGAPTWY